MTLTLHQKPLHLTGPIRITTAGLTLDQPTTGAGLPWVRGTLELSPTASLALLLRVYTASGIPIIEAHAVVAVGTNQVTFQQLMPLGIEAYAHKPSTERDEIAQRIWTRRSYATIQLDTR